MSTDLANSHPVDPNLVTLAADAYVYGYPLVYDLNEVRAFSERGMGSVAAKPINEFSHATTLGGPGDKFVSINNDTVYSVAQLDLSGGALMLQVPDTGGAYYVLQFVDAWTNNFAYVGRRATGTAEQRYLLCPPEWDGPAPDDVEKIRIPTMIATIVGRFACDGPKDLDRVAALQRQLTLRPVDPVGQRFAIPTSDLPAGPTDEGGIPADIRFFDEMRLFLAAFPPGPADRAYQERFAGLGLTTTDSPYRAPDPDLSSALTQGIKEGRARIEAAVRTAPGQPSVHGWHVGLHVFDYNVDHLEIGTVDEPQWKLTDRSAAYLTRAAAARAGLWGTHAYEAAYAQIFTDADGEQLTGARTYTLRFSERPPVDGFWSVTMYDVPNYWLVDNPINRYSVGDRTPGLRYAKDGSLTIVIAHDRPNFLEAPNWLPAPAGDFRPILRMYQPRAAILDGSYQLPPIKRRS